MEDDDFEEEDDEVEQQDGTVEDEERKRKTKRRPLIVDPEFAAFHFAPKKPPPRKLTLKLFSGSNKTSTPAEDPFIKNWHVLQLNIEAIQSMKKTEHTMESLYQMVENLCLEKKASDTYKSLFEQIRAYLHEECRKIVQSEDVNNVNLLVTIKNLWEDFCTQLRAIQSIFLVLDRMYVLHDRSLLPIWDMGLSIFHQVVLDEFSLGKKIGLCVIDQITAERNGNKVELSVLSCVLWMLHSLNVYVQYFETEFIATTAQYYKKESETLITELDTASYLNHVCVRLAEEKSRGDFYLQQSTKSLLTNTLHTQLIEERMQCFVSKGTAPLLSAHRLAELKTMYDLVGKVATGRNILRLEFSEFIKKHGKTIVTDPARDSTLVKELMSFKNKIDECVEKSFSSDEKFGQSAKDAFNYFINTRQNRPAELIAKFMDGRLRAGNKESSEEELDTVMDKAVQIFRFIQGKDVFEAFYKKDLAKRLLLGRSASVDAEKAMLSKLRAECGPGFTHKLEGMFKDMDVSDSLNTAFKQYCSSHKVELRPDLSVNVLTMGMWPKYDPSKVVIPSELSGCLEKFHEFYGSKHNGRKLQWQHSLGQAILRSRFNPKMIKELVVSLFQATVLLLFNSRDEWTFNDIVEATQIEEKELCRTLQSLACAKYKVLLKVPKGREVEKDDKFVFNQEFDEKLFRIRICQVQMKETEKEKQQTEEEVSQDRLYQIDAAVVRIMKTRKTLTHQNLIQELFHQLRFPVKAADLKKRIASLIERDYMNRDTSDSNTYHYVA